MIYLIAANDLSTEAAHAIQLALAPVFLLLGIASLLNVMTGRLSRIIDRGRHLTESPSSPCRLSPERLGVELRMLERRRRHTSRAIAACTLAALLVCVVIAMLFLEVLLGLPLKWLEGTLFAGATLSLVLGLSLFLREVHLASHAVRIEFHEAAKKAPLARDA